MSRSGVGLWAVIFAFIGFVLQLCIVLAIGFGQRWQNFLYPVMASLIGLLIGSFAFGFLFANVLTSINASRFRSGLTGAFIGWLSLWIQALAGSSVEFFAYFHRDSHAFGNYIFKPTFWIVFWDRFPPSSSDRCSEPTSGKLRIKPCPNRKAPSTRASPQPLPSQDAPQRSPLRPPAGLARTLCRRDRP
jgi:hypothetical protein